MSLATVILIVSLSLLFYKVGISNTGLMIGVICTYFITNFIGGFIFGKVNEKRKFLYGALIGLIYFIVLMIISIICSNNTENFSAKLVVSLASCIIGGMAEGMLSN